MRESIDRAVMLEPKEPRHHLQRAMTCLAELRAADGEMARWKWHHRTTAAYRAALELDAGFDAARTRLAELRNDEKSEAA